jgi:hypothetical protein
MAKKTILSKLHKPVHPVLAFVLFGLVAIAGMSALVLRSSQNSTTTAQQYQTQSIPTATPVPINTSTWKTYTDWKYGYSVKLPPEFAGYRPIKGLTGANPDPDSTGMMEFEDTTLSGNYPNRTAKYGFNVQLALASPQAQQCTTDQECYNLLTSFYHDTADGMRVMPIQAKILDKDIKGLAVLTPSGTGTTGKDISLSYFYNVAVNGKRFSCVVNFNYPKGFQQAQTENPVINAILSTISFNH